jgi:serine/threonine protein kinase
LLVELKKHGIIHRDIKHLNYLYNIKEKKGVLIDFGAAEISWEYTMKN